MPIPLFFALHDEAPHVLTDLRDRPDTLAAVSAWAAAWGLDSEQIRSLAQVLRHNWTLRPEWAPPARPEFGLTRGSVMIVRRVVREGSPEDLWCRAAMPEALPDPHEETLEEYLRRARALYKARERVMYPQQRMRGIRSHSERFYRWFVQVHVLRTRPSDVAKRQGVDRAAVSRETAKVAAWLGLQRRAWRRGRRVEFSPNP